MRKNFDVLLSEEAKNFIKSLSPKVQKKIAYNIQKSKQQIRLLAFWDMDKKSLIICSHGFIKKTNKVPQSEIKKAQEFRKKYFKA